MKLKTVFTITALFSLITPLPVIAETNQLESALSATAIEERLATIDDRPQTTDYYQGFNEGFNEGFEAGLAAGKANQPNRNNYQMLMNNNPRPLIQGWSEGYVKGYEEGYNYGNR